MIGGSEIFLIILVIILLFGPKQIPEIMRGLGKGVAEIKKASEELKKDVNANLDDSSNGLSETLRNVKKDVDEIKSNLTSNLKL